MPQHHRHHQTLIHPPPPLFLYPLSSSPPPPPSSPSSQAHTERPMGFSAFEEESLPHGRQSFDGGDDWGMLIGKEMNCLFGLDDFLLDDPLPTAEPDAVAQLVTGKETQEQEAAAVTALAVEDNKSKYPYSFSSTAAAAVSPFVNAALAPPLPLSEINLPEHDAAELEWVSRMTDDSQSEMPAYHHQLLLQARPPPPPSMTPTAIVDTNITTTTTNNCRPRPVNDMVAPVKAKRSKRARSLVSVSSSSSWSWGLGEGGCPYAGAGDVGGPSLVFIDSCPSNSSSSATATASSTTTTTTTTTTTCSSSSYSSSSSPSSQLLHAHPLFEEMHVYFPRPPMPHHPYNWMTHAHTRQQKTETKPKRRGRKPKAVRLAGETRAKSKGTNNGGGGERRCGHCGVNKTPQWRTGPMGAKTLCNACGVRYKSGRLLPEYRPACSPTFVSHVHSNSHRKVIEMRRKKQEEEEEEEPQDQHRRRQSVLVSAAPPIASC